MTDITERLQSLARFEHDDKSIGAEAAAEILRLRSELEEAKKDAGRYQRLRGMNTFDGDAIFVAMRCTDPAGGFSHNVLLCDDSLDAAIDAEMAKG